MKQFQTNCQIYNYYQQNEKETNNNIVLYIYIEMTKIMYLNVPKSV